MDSPPTRTERICGLIALVGPLALYSLTSAAAPTWLDSGEFLASAAVLGAAHPPGHPLFITLVKLATLVPVGPFAARAAAVAALSAALASYLLFRIAVVVSRAADRGSHPSVAPIFGCISALALSATPALWGQATRPEVYATQLALVLGCLLALAHFSARGPGNGDGRFLVAAALGFSLSLTNHHFLSFLLMPGIIVLLTADALGGWRRVLRLLAVGALPAGLIGLVPYAHLVLRAGAPGAVSLGTATTPGELLWVVSARVFQRSMVEPPSTSFGDRCLDAAFLVAGQLGPVLTVLALGGLYFLARRRVALGLTIVLWLVATWIARSWMGFDRSNPDVLGYLLVPSAIIALGTARIGPLLATVLPARRTVRVGAATVAGVGIVAAGVASGLDARAVADLSETRGAEAVASELLERLPPRAVVVTDLFQTTFNLWAAQTVEGSRPDVAHFHLPFIGFPGYVQQVHAEHRDLRGVLRAALSEGGLSDRELSGLAQRRPVFVEPPMTAEEPVDPFLLPSGLLWEAGAEPLSSTDLSLALPAHVAAWDAVLARAGPDLDEQTLRVLVWRLFTDGLILARRGEQEGASQMISRALGLAPRSVELVAFDAALSEADGRLDVERFLPVSARRRPVEQADDEEPDVLDF